MCCRFSTIHRDSHNYLKSGTGRQLVTGLCNNVIEKVLEIRKMRKTYASKVRLQDVGSSQIYTLFILNIQAFLHSIKNSTGYTNKSRRNNKQPMKQLSEHKIEG